MKGTTRNRYDIPSRLESFSRYCRDEGYELLVEDYRFIDRMLTDLNQGEFKVILEGYLKEWSKGITETGSSNVAQGQGRRRANKWLFEVTERKRNEIHKMRDTGRPWDTCFD